MVRHFEFRFDGIDPESKPAHFGGIVNARYDLLQLCFRHSSDNSGPLLPQQFKTEPNSGHDFELLTFNRQYQVQKQESHAVLQLHRVSQSSARALVPALGKASVCAFIRGMVAILHLGDDKLPGTNGTCRLARARTLNLDGAAGARRQQKK